MFAAAATAGAEDAILAEAAAGEPAGGDLRAQASFTVAETGSHPSGCACCQPRSAAAAALARLFLARARGDVAFFRRIVAATSSAQGAAAVREAVASDPLVSGRFRLG